MADTIIMPQLGETVAEGKILAWFKAVGDDVKIGDRLFEVETDKVTIEVEAIASGKLSEIKIGQGVTAKVGTIVALLGGGNASASEKPDVLKPPTLSAFEEVKTPSQHFGNAKAGNGVQFSPLARRQIVRNNLKIEEIANAAAAKGLRRVSEDDVARLTPTASMSTAQAAAPIAGDIVTLNTIRARTADRLTENWRNIPHVFQAIDIDFTEVEIIRARHKERFKQETGFALTYLPFIARACCIALQAFPLVNAHFAGNALRVSKDINLGIAVDLNHNGLVVPVVHAVQDFTLQGLAKAIGRQVEKARAGALKTADMSGGTYSITNNGAFGTSFTTPIINAQQVAILSSDAIRKKPAVVGDAVVPRLMGTLGQSFDHRAFDGAYAAAFLSKLKDTIETKKWAGELGEDT
jgi:pyruvate/2-oxoglutarate dehydrogenase complex dihydrolipoamide acyltransferase (E2) component